MTKIFPYYLNYRKFSKIFFEFWCLLATMHPIFYKLNLHAYSITHFLFLCEPKNYISKGRAISPPPPPPVA